MAAIVKLGVGQINGHDGGQLGRATGAPKTRFIFGDHRAADATAATADYL